MSFKKDVVLILKEFEQKDYAKGGVSIAPESYEAIADKIYRDLHDKYWFKCLEHHCQENDAIIRYLFDGNKISEVWVKIDGESSWTVFGYNDFLKGVHSAELFYGEHEDASFFTLAIPTVNKTLEQCSILRKLF